MLIRKTRFGSVVDLEISKGRPLKGPSSQSPYRASAEAVNSSQEGEYTHNLLETRHRAQPLPNYERGGITVIKTNRSNRQVEDWLFGSEERGGFAVEVSSSLSRAKKGRGISISENSKVGAYSHQVDEERAL